MAVEIFNELVGICDKRSATYGLLARIYRIEIDEEFLQILHSMRFPAATGNTDADEGYRMLATFLSNTWERTVTDLAVDYTRVFIGYGVDAYSAAFPYESVYTSEKRLKMQDARDEVLAIYHAYALDKAESWNENEDHVALELEFMQFMSDRTSAALKAGDEDQAVMLLQAQRGFFEDHLSAWIPMFTEDIRRFAKTDFYLGVSKITDGFLAEDGRFLESVLEESGDEPESTEE